MTGGNFLLTCIFLIFLSGPDHLQKGCGSSNPRSHCGCPKKCNGVWKCMKCSESDCNDCPKKRNLFPLCCCKNPLHDCTTATTTSSTPWNILVSQYSSSIRALNVSNNGSLQEAINATIIFLDGLKKLPPGGNDINILVATHELESFAVKYGKTHLTANESAVIVQKLFEMKIQRVLGNNTEPITCSKSNGTESIVIPSENFKAQDTVTVCMLYHGEVRKWIPGEERVNGLNGKTIKNFTLSNIIGSTLDPRPQVILQQNLSVILRYDKGLEAHCVFWDFTAKSNANGSWSSKGCSVVNRTKTEITCTCNHLTNFAVLMHVGVDNEVPADHKVALKVITYVGCALSLVGEALTAVAFFVLL